MIRLLLSLGQVGTQTGFHDKDKENTFLKDKNKSFLHIVNTGGEKPIPNIKPYSFHVL